MKQRAHIEPKQCNEDIMDWRGQNTGDFQR